MDQGDINYCPVYQERNKQMVNKNIRNIFSAVIMTLLILLTAVSTTIASTTINGSNASPVDDFSEVSEKTSTTTFFSLVFGVVIINAVVILRLPVNYTYFYLCSSVEKVTVIGYGSYGTSSGVNISWAHFRFYMNTFTNVSELAGFTYRKLEPSVESQHFSTFVTLRRPCLIQFNV
jgi:hypothetical protein